MLRLVSDENFNGDMVRGLLLRHPALALYRVQDVGLEEADDPTILAWAAANNRIVLTHDQATMPDFAYARVGVEQPCLESLSCLIAELRQAFADSVEDYLEFCAERGEAPDQPLSGRFTVRLSPEQHRKVILAAEKAGKDVAQWVAEAFEQATGSTGQ
jgi:predicted HicB family RNase H-like nuclease